jgi:hypothetical protein
MASHTGEALASVTIAQRWPRLKLFDLSAETLPRRVSREKSRISLGEPAEISDRRCRRGSTTMGATAT